MLESKTHLYEKIEKLKYEKGILEVEKRLLQFQLSQAVNDYHRTSLKIKEMENGRSNDNK